MDVNVPINEVIARIIFEATSKDDKIQPTVTKVIRALATYEERQLKNGNNVNFSDFMFAESLNQDVWFRRLFTGELLKHTEIDSQNPQLLPLVYDCLYIQKIKSRLEIENYLSEFLTEHGLTESEFRAVAVFNETIDRTTSYLNRWNQAFEKVTKPSLMQVIDDVKCKFSWRDLITLANARRIGVTIQDEEINSVCLAKMESLGIKSKLLDAYDYRLIEKKVSNLSASEISDSSYAFDSIYDNKETLRDIARLKLLTEYYSENHTQDELNDIKIMLRGKVKNEHEMMFKQGLKMHKEK